MNTVLNNIQMTEVNLLHNMSNRLLGLFAAGVILCTLSCSNPVQTVAEPEVDPILHQAVFETPEDAANSLSLAVKNYDQNLFNKLLGPDFREILPLEDVTAEDLDNFDNAWEKHHSLLPQGDKKMLLAIGEGKWTLPIPIVASSEGWHFNILEGLERMRIRRIGRNELATMQSVLAYYDAQMEYAEQDRNGDGTLEYAQKFISTPGTQDGLYWKVDAGEELSPLGALFADRSPKGGYHGYFYRILKAQGKNANGGKYSYMIGNHMRAGFAIIAWPEEYGESGIMSFTVSHNGIVYQQNLGDNGADIAENMSVYDPDKNWIPAKEVNGP